MLKQFVFVVTSFHSELRYLGINEVIQADLQVKVTELIIRVLITNEGLHYYQVIIFVDS